MIDRASGVGVGVAVAVCVLTDVSMVVATVERVDIR